MAPEHQLRIGNPNSNDKATYRIEVNGRIRQLDGGEKGDSGDGGWVEGRITGGWDTFKFRGTITKFELDGGAQVEIEGQSIARKNAVGYDTRDGFSGGSKDESVADKIVDAVTGDEDGGERAGGTNPKGDATPAYQGTPDGILSSDGEYRRFFDLPIPNDEELRVGVDPGTYDPPAIQRSILHARPEYSIQVLGTQDPYKTDISRANHNFTVLCKDEHFWVEGMVWGRTQFSGAGDPYCKNMVFTDRRGKGQSALGGKRACGRFIGCDIGHRNDPDEYAAYYYGGGTVLFDRGNTFRATGDAYIGANNHVELHIHGSNDFASGRKEVVEGSGIYPNDLKGGMNVIQHGELR